MGFIDKFLNFGNDRKGRIISWTIIIVFAIVTFVGISMTAVGASSSLISRIHLSAPNIRYLVGTDAPADQKGNYPGYHLEISSINTPITAIPAPMNNNTPIVFSTHDTRYIDIRNSRISPGGTAIITIKKINGMFEFTTPEDDIDKIRIDVRSGNRTEVIYVKIMLDPGKVQVSASLERNMLEPFENFFSPTTHLEMNHFINMDSPHNNPIKYRVRLTFSVFGEIMYDTANPGHYTFVDANGNTQQRFEAEEISEYSSFVNLIEEEYDYFIFMLPRSREEDETVRFRIWCNFNGQKFFTETEFLLNIVGWIPES